jgi:hypothetical protein
MSTKILVNSLGQHIIADVKTVTNKETNELLAYWVKSPRVISYRGNEDGTVSIDFIDYCPVGSSLEFSIASHHIVSILDAKAEVEERYLEIVTPNPVTIEELETEPTIEPEVVSEEA